MSAPGRILVVDDAPANVKLLDQVLRASGYEVVTAASGREGLEKLAAAKPDLVLLDVVMPELDGWQAFLQIEALAPGVKVLFTTGYAASVLPADFASHGARLISKPYKRERLLAEVRDIIGAQAPNRAPLPPGAGPR